VTPLIAQVWFNRARGLIAMPNRWTHGAWARNAKGKRCSARDSNAVKWDLAGALCRIVLGTDGDAEWNSNLDILSGYLQQLAGGKTLIEVNDSQGHLAVIRLLDKALDQLPKRTKNLEPPTRRRKPWRRSDERQPADGALQDVRKADGASLPKPSSERVLLGRVCEDRRPEDVGCTPPTGVPESS
jgi:hypothetical protein